MFRLRTGTPGAGKTLSLIHELKGITDRPIYYSQIPGLKLPWTEITDPANYHLWLPDHSIYILDECQKIFPVRPPKDSVPPGISFIETHRHRGIDIYFITQHSSLLDHHARRLIGEHTHLQRNFGMAFSVMYTNNKLFDPTNYHEKSECQKTQFRFPKETFELYKSAEVHTHKIKFPKKLLILPLLFAMVGYGTYKIYSYIHPEKKLEIVPTYEQSKSENPQSTVNAPSSKPKIDWPTAFIPAIKGLPYTAPIYKDLAVPVSMPMLAGCVSNEKRCTCYTQQATKIDMDDEQCRLHAKQASFNPFLADKNQNNDVIADRR